MSDIFNLSRRRFLRVGSLAGGGLILGVNLPGCGTYSEAGEEPQPEKGIPNYDPNAFVRIGKDDSVTIVVTKAEMGQGTYTALPMIVADELDADWTRVRAEAAPVNPAYNSHLDNAQSVGTSTSTWSEFERLRRVGAAARAMLIAAAAAEWKVDAKTCKTESGHVLHADGRKLSYGRLAEAASRLTPPKQVELKDPKAFKIIGKPIRRLDSLEKTNGKAVFGIDVVVPGMLVAVIARPPVFGAKVKSFDDSKTKEVAGVRHVVQIDAGIAVVADAFWPASVGRDELKVVWDEGPLADLDSEAQEKQYEALAKLSGAVAQREGDVSVGLAQAAKKLEAAYWLPYLAHAPMEPLNCVADVKPDRCELWVGTQCQTADRDFAAAACGLKPEQVKLNTQYLGGGFGRRSVDNGHFVLEAVQISKAVKAPVKVIWTREDDIRGGYYRPSVYHTLSAGLHAEGHPLALHHRIVSQSFYIGSPFEPYYVKNGVDESAVEGAIEQPYHIPNLQVEWKHVPGGVPTLWWRSVGHTHNAFVVETFMDEMAHAAGKDPLEFRRELLEKHPRTLRVLELAAEKAGWGKPLPEGHALGLAVHESFRSFVAQVAEVSIFEEEKVVVHRVVCAIDCGPVVNPETVRAQMEGGIVFGLSAALYGEITLEKGRVRQKNFDDYPVLRFNEMPTVDVHIVPSTDQMGGVGETSVSTIAPAVANALFSLTGRRIRRLPIRAEDLQKM